jgi:hypothetical protein
MSQSAKKPTVIQGGAATKAKKAATQKPPVMDQQFIQIMTNGFVTDYNQAVKADSATDKDDAYKTYHAQIKMYADFSRESLHGAIAATYVLISTLGKEEGEKRFKKPRVATKQKEYNWKREVIVDVLGYERTANGSTISKLLSAFNNFDKAAKIKDKTNYAQVFKYLTGAGGVEKLLFNRTGGTAKDKEDAGRDHYDDLVKKKGIGSFSFAKDAIKGNDGDFVVLVGAIDQGDIKVIEQVDVDFKNQMKSKGAELLGGGSGSTPEKLKSDVEYWLNVVKFSSMLGSNKHITVSSDGKTTTISNAIDVGGWGGAVVEVKGTKDWFGAKQPLVLDHSTPSVEFENLRDLVGTRAKRVGLKITGDTVKGKSALKLANTDINFVDEGNNHIKQVYVADGLTRIDDVVLKGADIEEWFDVIVTEHGEFMDDKKATIPTKEEYTKDRAVERRSTTISLVEGTDELTIKSPVLSDVVIKLPKAAVADYSCTFKTDDLRKLVRIMKDRRQDSIEVHFFEKLISFHNKSVKVSLPQYAGKQYSDGNLTSR